MRVSSAKVLGVLNGHDMPQELLLAWARSADVIYAADGGAASLLDAGLKPIVVGDFDSLDKSTLPPDIRTLHDPDQDSTDCDKLLHAATSDGVAEITLIGVEGDRLDHVLATLSSLVGRRKKIRLGLRRGMGWVVPCGEPFALPTRDGQRLSIIPLTLCWGVSLSNTQWELRDAELRPGLHVSISNRACGPVSLAMAGGTALAIVEHQPSEMPYWQP